MVRRRIDAVKPSGTNSTSSRALPPPAPGAWAWFIMGLDIIGLPWLPAWLMVEEAVIWWLLVCAAPPVAAVTGLL